MNKYNVYMISDFLYAFRNPNSKSGRFIIVRHNVDNFVSVSYTKADISYVDKIYGRNNYTVLLSTESTMPKKLRRFMYKKLKQYKIGVGREHIYDISNFDLRNILLELNLKPNVSYGLFTSGELSIWN